ncbi:MAG TPA: hypothetical protein VEB23_13470 [Ramlibacter sp.]|nr:hypothetical protein [Ramlibacter sp.]
MRLLAAALLPLVSPALHAHPGHGMVAASHWHASDLWGFLLLGAAVLAAIWFSRGGK